MLKNSVRTSKKAHCICITKDSQLMLFTERIAVWFEDHTKPISTLCGQNRELFNVIVDVTCDIAVL
jgi:hypothetical protein